MKYSLNNEFNCLQTYKIFQRYYPMQSIQHFNKYGKLKCFLHRYKQTLMPNTPESKQHYLMLLTKTSLGHNFWMRHLMVDEWKDKSWEDIENEFRTNQPLININLHPEVETDSNTIKLIEIQNERRLLDLNENYYRSKVINQQLPSRFISKIFLGATDDYDIWLQSQHGGYRMNHKLVKCVGVDCTFTKPYCLGGTMYSQILFILAQIDAPSICYTHNQYPSAMCLLTGKSADTYKKAFTVFKQQNDKLYGYKFKNIKQLSSDMEYALFTSARNIVFVLALFLFCLFHYMQANVRKLGSLGLGDLLKENKKFYAEIMKYLYAVFVHPKWVIRYQDSRRSIILKLTPRYYKLAVKKFFQYNAKTYREMFPVEWTNCTG